MHELVLSKAAKAAVGHFSESELLEFEEICFRLAYELPIMERAGYVRGYSFYTLHCLRYFDHLFPYVIAFDHTTIGPKDQRPVIVIHLILRATTGGGT